MSVKEVIHNRRSCRKYSKRKVSKENLDEILSSAINAPSPKNDQPWHFCVVSGQDKEKTAAIMENALCSLLIENQKKGINREDILQAFSSVGIIRDAPVVVFVYLDYKLCTSHEDGLNWELQALDAECTHIQAVGAAIQNMLLTATELGIDSLWIGDIFYAYSRLTEYLEMEGCLMAAVAFGYGEDDMGRTSRVELREKVKYRGEM